MTDAPERLWLGLEPDECGEPIVQNYVDASEDKSKFTEYIRKDVVERMVPQWQPISTAPRDGTWIMLFSPRGDEPDCTHWIGAWGVIGEEAWCNQDDIVLWEDDPTHWMPLPEPPND